MKKKQKINLKIGDRVTVICGSHKHKNGEIIFINQKTARIIVKGVNFRYKCIKPDALNKVGKTIQIENSIHSSNVKLTINEIP